MTCFYFVCTVFTTVGFGELQLVLVVRFSILQYSLKVSVDTESDKFRHYNYMQILKTLLIHFVFLIPGRRYLPCLLWGAGALICCFFPHNRWGIDSDGKRLSVKLVRQIFAVCLMCTAACVFGVILGELQVGYSDFQSPIQTHRPWIQEIYAASNMRVRDMEVGSKWEIFAYFDVILLRIGACAALTGSLNAVSAQQ